MPAQDSQSLNSQDNQKFASNISTQRLIDVFSIKTPDPGKFLGVVIEESVGLLASDILFEPGRNEFSVRIRIDGVLYPLGDLSISIYNQLTAKIKVLSGLDPTDKRKIQEGQFTHKVGEREVNLRVEIAQTIHGELVVFRIHEKSNIIMKLSQLGFNPQAFEVYKKMLDRNAGLVLSCGPTGSGKTTTLYSTISKLSGNNLNIMTIEDPVEFVLDGVNQMQVHNDIGFTFAAGLKTILRLSPDVVLVGEIRDAETAGIATESGLTGQLVLSTVHAQDSMSALFRLVDLGIEAYLLNSSLTGIVAQRLVRKNCPSCSSPYQPTEDEIAFFQSVIGRPPKQLMKGVGCSECNNLGYKGRTGIYEVLLMDARLRDLLRSKVNEDTLRKNLMQSGFMSLLVDGLLKCEMGITTISEVLRNGFRVV
ncbi:type II/IV secretion system protein [Candidatus Woesebacteria bacterium]|nr:type II/IV secretion system protein [Candidatus Woesebacteria bacterium]